MIGMPRNLQASRSETFIVAAAGIVGNCSDDIVTICGGLPFLLHQSRSGRIRSFVSELKSSGSSEVLGMMVISSFPRGQKCKEGTHNELLLVHNAGWSYEEHDQQRR
jgi:hypothetical protein